MHPSTISSSSASAEVNGRTSNNEQYHYPPISTLRRPGRPSHINLSNFDQNNCHSAHDPEIYSAPICYIPRTEHHHHRPQMQLTPQAYSASFQYPQARPLEQHIRIPTQNHHMQLCPPPPPQQQQQQQQQTLIEPYPHTPHTFPLQGSPNQCFYFPPSTIPVRIISSCQFIFRLGFSSDWQ